MSTEASPLIFRPVDTEAMESILPYLNLHKERSCDFSYGGLLMWVDKFKYEYAIHNDTLYIKGLAPGSGESTQQTMAFSVPMGHRPLIESVATLRQWCNAHEQRLIFSAVPEESAQELMAIGAVEMTELPSWEDYIYEAKALASLGGKKLSKKRNHVNQFKSLYPDWDFHLMRREDVGEIERDTNRDVEREASQSKDAKHERELAGLLLAEVAKGNPHLIGGVLRVNGRIIAYTIGDIVGDTLYIHVEKAERSISGSFEMINRCFAETVIGNHPAITFINREDDAGDEGLRQAKQSYHPLYLLKKYNVRF